VALGKILLLALSLSKGGWQVQPLAWFDWLTMNGVTSKL